MYFDTCVSHTFTPFKENFVTLNEDHTGRTLDGIAFGLTIRGTGTVKYVVIDDTGKPYNMMLEAYWVPELKHLLVSPQDIHTEEGNTMSFQNHSGFEGEGRFTKFMVNPNVKCYHRQLSLQTTMMQYKRWNNLLLNSAQLTHAQQLTASALEATICETRKHNKKLTADQRLLLQYHFRLGHNGFSHVRFLSMTVPLPLKNPKSVANYGKFKCSYYQFGKASRRTTKTQTIFKDKYKEMGLKNDDLVSGQRVSVDQFQSDLPGGLYNSKWRTDAKDIFHGGYIFVNHASGYI